MSAAPSLLTLMDGRRKLPPPKEYKDQIALVDLLDRFKRHDVLFNHPASGELRDKETAGKVRAMGTRRGWPDLALLIPEIGTAYLELKRYRSPLRRGPDCDLSDEQKAFRAACIRAGEPHAVAYGLREAVDVLTGWNVWRTVPTIQGGSP